MTMGSCLLDEDGRVGGDAFLAAGEAEFLGGGGFDGDIFFVGGHHLCETLFHGGNVGIEFGLLGGNGDVGVAEFPSFFAHERHCLAEQDFGVDIEKLAGGVGEVVPDVAHICGTENGVAEGMNQHIGIGVTQETEGMLNLDAA